MTLCFLSIYLGLFHNGNLKIKRFYLHFLYVIYMSLVNKTETHNPNDKAKQDR